MYPFEYHQPIVYFLRLAKREFVREIQPMEALPPFFWDLYSDLPQQGPGSDASTIGALNSIPDLEPRPRILDLGCGAGRQSFCLARHTGGEVIAVDNHAPFLDKLNQAAEENELAHRVFSYHASMDALTFPPSSFDIIWSEGAIYIIGFERGLHEWNRFLKQGGVLGVTEVTWLRDDPPAELREFWNTEYPAISTRAVNESLITAADYKLLDSFVLPDSDWWDNYYQPLEQRARELRQRFANDEQALAVIVATEREIELFRKYSEYYGYVFYLMRKTV